jgi:FkbM family methyltransferase
MKTKYKIYIAKLISFFLRPFFNKDHVYSRGGIKWNLDLNEGIDLSIFLFGTSEKKLKNLVKIFRLDRKITVLDIGANVGSISLPIAKMYKKSKIYSIEPTDYAFKKLNKNLNLNKDLCKNIFLNQLFISKINRPSKVWSSWNFKNKNDKHKKHFGSLQKIKKNSYISLNKFVSSNKIKLVNFIKLDVDGHELDVLTSGEKFIKDQMPIIFIEIAPYLYPEFGYQCADLIKYIKNLGYIFYDDNLKKIINIDSNIKKMSHGSSKNFFLMKN